MFIELNAFLLFVSHTFFIAKFIKPITTLNSEGETKQYYSNFNVSSNLLCYAFRYVIKHCYYGHERIQEWTNYNGATGILDCWWPDC